MIGFLRGILVETGKDRILVEVNGIGFEVMVPATVLTSLPPAGAPVLLYTRLVVREDAWQVYGFLEAQDRDIFSLLLGISGIGPRLACTLLSVLPGAHLVNALLRGDVASLARVPGVGRKTAQRMVLEAGDRLKRLGARQVQAGTGEPYDDAAAALLELGYHADEFYPWIEAARKDLATEVTGQEVLKYVLQKMVSRRG